MTSQHIIGQLWHLFFQSLDVPAEKMYNHFEVLS